MALRVIKSGFLSLLQDYGRYGYQHAGLTHSGPLDEHAYLWANHLLGNHYNATQLEISYGVFSAEFTTETVIALCGANLNASINGTAVLPWQTYCVRKGDVIDFLSPQTGMRCYLAIKGGFKVEKILSSCATAVREKIGGLKRNGVKLEVGDVITYDRKNQQMMMRVPERFIPNYKESITLRFVANISSTSAGIEAQKIFQNSSFEVAQNIDRMGYRLSGQPIVAPLGGIISQGVSVGAIQLPSDGQPIVLMKDRQTMGGYPLLGCVSSLDLPLLAQSAPGVKVSFEAVGVDVLEAELLRHKTFFGTAM